MPFKTIEAAKAANFPTTKENADLSLEQINKLAEIYDAIKAGNNADDPMAVAWNAWLNVFKKVGDKWVLAEKEQNQQNTVTSTIATKHDVILQTLDTKLDDIFYAKEPFQNSISTWDNLPLVFAQKHPDAYLFESNQQKALNDINGLIVGYIQNPYINITGHPRLMSALNITNPKIDTLIEQGKVSVSTAFMYRTDPDNTITSVRPNHVLIFEEDLEFFPNDRGSVILNQSTNIDKIITEVKAFFTRLLKNNTEGKTPIEANQHKKRGVLKKDMDKVEELAVELQTANIGIATSKAEIERLTAEKAALDTELIAKNTAIDTLKTDHVDALKVVSDELTVFKDQETARHKTDLDAKWEKLKKEQIPLGLTHKEEDEKKLHERFEMDPHAFMMELVTYNKAAATGETGEEFDAKTDTDLASIRELKQDTGRQV